jgi:hypothetical protein
LFFPLTLFFTLVLYRPTKPTLRKPQTSCSSSFDETKYSNSMILIAMKKCKSDSLQKRIQCRRCCSCVVSVCICTRGMCMLLLPQLLFCFCGVLLCCTHDEVYMWGFHLEQCVCMLMRSVSSRRCIHKRGMARFCFFACPFLIGSVLLPTNLCDCVHVLGNIVCHYMWLKGTKIFVYNAAFEFLFEGLNTHHDASQFPSSRVCITVPHCL